METNNRRKTNKNKTKKHKKQTTLLSNITLKNTRIPGENSFFIDWKQNKQQDKSKNASEKQQDTKTKPT